nr:phospholipase-like protein [Tanacetum cinerariifolium]
MFYLINIFISLQLSNPNVTLISSPEEVRQAWFIASIDFIKGLADQDGKFLQDEEARVNGIEHHNVMCGDTENGNFVEGIAETIFPKTNQMSVEEGDGVLNSEGDGVHLSQTNDVIQQASKRGMMFWIPREMASTCHKQMMLFNKRLSNEAKASSFSSNPGNDKDASHLDDLMEIDGENVKDGFTNSQDHLHLHIKALESKTENPTLDLVVPPKDDDCILRTRKPNDAYDVVEDDYMLLLNDEERPVKSSLNDMELEQEPDKIDVKQGILEQQPNAPKGKTIVLEETIEVKVKENPGLGRGVGPFKVKKKNFQRALRPNYLLRSAKDRKKKLAMALKPPFGQQSATTPVPINIKSTFMKTEVNVPPFDLEDISGQPRIRSMNDIMTHESFVENLSRPDDYKSDKVVLFGYLCRVLTLLKLAGRMTITLIYGLIKCDYISNGHMYRLPWQAVEKVYFLVNEPKTHWFLAELEIRTGVVTFYDSLGWAGRFRRRWWRRMKKLFPEKLTVYLVMHGIIKSKGISADDYKITYKYADAPFQASLFGDCGIR